MSNHVYSVEQNAALFAQFSKVMEIAREGQRSPDTVSRALQAVISDDDIVVVPKVTTTPAGRVLHVTGNARSAKEAIYALDCPVKWGLAEKPAEIPMIMHPVDCRARAIPLGQVRTTEEIYSLYPIILTPAEFFALGAKFPDEQREDPLFIVWLDGVGRFCCAVLNVGSSRRDVLVRRSHPDSRWSGRYRVPVRE